MTDWKKELTDSERRQLEKLERAHSATSDALRDLKRTLKSRCESRLRAKNAKKE